MHRICDYNAQTKKGNNVKAGGEGKENVERRAESMAERLSRNNHSLCIYFMLVGFCDTGVTEDLQDLAGLAPSDGVGGHGDEPDEESGALAQGPAS